MLFKRLFGESEAEQMAFLEKRVIFTAAAIVATIVLVILTDNEQFIGIIAIVCYVWGWRTMKAMKNLRLPGFILVLLENEIVANLLSVLFFLAYILVGYFIGMFTALVGIGRYIYLKVKAGR